MPRKGMNLEGRSFNLSLFLGQSEDVRGNKLFRARPTDNSNLVLSEKQKGGDSNDVTHFFSVLDRPYSSLLQFLDWR
jgi:hypothetical protein